MHFYNDIFTYIFRVTYPLQEYSVVECVKLFQNIEIPMVIGLGEGRGVYRVLVGKPKGRKPLGRPRRRWEDNIRMDLREVGCGCVDWMELAQDRDRWRALVSGVMNLRVP